MVEFVASVYSVLLQLIAKDAAQLKGCATSFLLCLGFHFANSIVLSLSLFNTQKYYAMPHLNVSLTRLCVGNLIMIIY